MLPLKFTLFLLILVFSLSTCKKPKSPKPADCNEHTIIKTPAKLMNTFCFKDSSYWIYKDSANGWLDSTYVKNWGHSISNNNEFYSLYTRCYEYYFYNLYSDSVGISNVRIEPANISDTGSLKYQYFRFEVWNKNYSRSVMINNDSFCLSYSDIFYGAKMSQEKQLFVNGIIYKNIVHLINDAYTKVRYDEAWYSDSVGLIKYIKKDKSVWELLRYKITK